MSPRGYASESLSEADVELDRRVAAPPAERRCDIKAYRAKPGIIAHPQAWTPEQPLAELRQTAAIEAPGIDERDDADGVGKSHARTLAQVKARAAAHRGMCR